MMVVAGYGLLNMLPIRMSIDGRNRCPCNTKSFGDFAVQDTSGATSLRRFYW